MEQFCNIIRIEEGGVQTPYVVLERVGAAVDPEKLKKDNRKIVGEARATPYGPGISYLICEMIHDVVWVDVVEEPKKEKPKRLLKVPTESVTKGQNVDVKL